MVTPAQTIDTMKRVQNILRAAQDDPRLRKRVADETAKWVRAKGTQGHISFEEFLDGIEKKLNIKKEGNGDATGREVHPNTNSDAERKTQRRAARPSAARKTRGPFGGGGPLS